MGFNELQHQVYGRIRHLHRDQEWTLDSFVDGLLHKAEFYGISGDLGWAIKSAIFFVEVIFGTAFVFAPNLAYVRNGGKSGIKRK